MNNTVKKLFGDFIAQICDDLKVKYIPNQNQKERIKIENESFLNRNKLYSSFLKEGDLSFDVGANIGNRVRSLLSIGAKVVAIEPQKSCSKYLKYKFGKKIEIISKGLGDKEEVKDFYISSANTLSSFSNEWIDIVKSERFKQHNWKKKVKTEMTTLDKLIEKYGIPKFIKIDVEGYELEVLKGLTKPIGMISFEYTVPEQVDKVIDCIKQILKYNPNIECNFSIGESMILELNKWLSTEQMISFVNSTDFQKTVFGDVYIRIKTV